MKEKQTYMRPDEIISMLSAEGEDMRRLIEQAGEVKARYVGDGLYLRGLIEYSNICRKNCCYCGIRRDGSGFERYTLSEKQVLDAARFAYERNYGSVVLQGGENISPEHIKTITGLLKEIKKMSDGRLGITLSMGEQTAETYREWFGAGAHRYLLRIETSNQELYAKLHPNDNLHRYESRIKALKDLKEAGFQVGTGVMIGLPGQTVEDLANDLIFMRGLDIDMCGMGPYVVCNGTPTAADYGHEVRAEKWRFDMTLKMIAALRIIMPDINIAATTALQALDPDGRVKAVKAGANVIMPNITPEGQRANYTLYNNKPFRLDSSLPEKQIKYGEWGDSPHFSKRKKEI